jgi:hypothetical protein
MRKKLNNVARKVPKKRKMETPPAPTGRVRRDDLSGVPRYEAQTANGTRWFDKGELSAALKRAAAAEAASA